MLKNMVTKLIATKLATAELSQDFLRDTSENNSIHFWGKFTSPIFFYNLILFYNAIDFAFYAVEFPLIKKGNSTLLIYEIFFAIIYTNTWFTGDDANDRKRTI